MSLHEVVDLSSLLNSENQHQSQQENLLVELETAISQQEIRLAAEVDANERLLKNEYHAAKNDSKLQAEHLNATSAMLDHASSVLKEKGGDKLKEIAHVIQEYESTRDDLSADIDDIEKEVDILEQLFCALDSPEVRKVNDEVSGLRQQTESKKKERAAKQNVVWKNQEMLQKERALLDTLQKSTAEKEVEVLRIEGERKKVDTDLVTRREADQAIDQGSKEKIQKMRDEARELREAVAELDAKLAVLRADDGKKQTEIAALNQSIGDLMIHNGNLKTDLDVTLVPELVNCKRLGEEEAAALIRVTDLAREKEQALAASHQKLQALVREANAATRGKTNFAEAAVKTWAMVEHLRTELGRIDQERLTMQEAAAALIPSTDATDDLSVARRAVLEIEEQRLLLEQQTATGVQQITELEQQLQGADPSPVRGELEAQEHLALLLLRRLSAEDRQEDAEEELECSQQEGSAVEARVPLVQVDASLLSDQRAAEERLERERALLDSCKEDLARHRKHRADEQAEEQESLALAQHREQLIRAHKASLIQLKQELRDEDEKFKLAVLAAQEGHIRIERELQRELTSLIKHNEDVQRGAAAAAAAAAAAEAATTAAAAAAAAAAPAVGATARGSGARSYEKRGDVLPPPHNQNIRPHNAPAPTASSKPRPNSLFDLIREDIDIDANDFASSDEEKADEVRGSRGAVGDSHSWSSSGSEDGNDAMETSRTSTGSGWQSNASHDSHETADTDYDHEDLPSAPSPPAVMQVHRKDTVHAVRTVQGMQASSSQPPVLSPRGGGAGQASQAAGQMRRKPPAAAASATSSTSRVSGPPSSQTASKQPALPVAKKKPSTVSSLSWDDSPAGKSLFGRYESSTFTSTSFSSSSSSSSAPIGPPSRRVTLDGENAPNVRGAPGGAARRATLEGESASSARGAPGGIAHRPHVQFQEPPKRGKGPPSKKV